MVPPVNLRPLVHGGDLGAARKLFPGAPEPFLDLSTGINPLPYPIPQLPPDLLARLPDPASLAKLAFIAAQAYGAPSAAQVVVAPGSQILVAEVARLVPPGLAQVLGPTYAEHARAARLAGHEVAEVVHIEQLEGAGLAIVVNPNNPDGRTVAKDTLLALADRLRQLGGVLLIDEAFMDVGPDGASLGDEVGLGNVVVLRSFGKFHGLAGLRLSFAVASPKIAERLAAALGPWPVSGMALAIATQALADTAWREATRASLAQAAARLDALLIPARLEVIGGTSLFRLARTTEGAELFQHLGRAGIFVRRFTEEPTWLRFGLPGGEPEWQRLAAALASFPRSR
jgi:cobalamin biosynthesis protein CobC